MSNAQQTGSIQDLNAGHEEALRGLLSSVNQARQNRRNIPEDEAKLLTDSLEQMLKDANSPNGESSATMNQRGGALNDEGLPIIEITEPVEDSSASSSQDREIMISNEPNIVPLKELSPAQRDQLYKRRDHILALLEAEEQEQTKENVKVEAQKRRDELDRRRVAAKAELDRIRAAKEMQRKMGRALVGSATTATVREQEKKYAQEVVDSSSTPSSSDVKEPMKSKKAVSFSDATNSKGEELEHFKETEKKSSDFGDVSIAPIANGRRRPINPTLLSEQPMKMEVVERIPGANPKQTSTIQPDSDDESVSNTSSIPETDDDSNSNDDESDDVETIDDELYFSEIQHQREITLQYLKLKNKIGSDIEKTMAEDASRDEWDQPEVPLDATLSTNPQKPRVSRFKCSRSGFTHSNSFAAPPPASAAANIIPAGQVNAVRHAVRMGNLKNNQLVGDEYDDDDDEEDAKAVTEFLRKGYITTMEYPPSASQPVPFQTQESLNSIVSVNSMPTLSEFSGKETMSESSTPLMTSKRSSPKLTPPLEGSQKVTTIRNSYFQKPPTTIKPHVTMDNVNDAVQSTQASLYTDAMVIDSPSYPFSSAPTQPAYKPRNAAASVMSADVFESSHSTSMPKLDGTRNKDKKISRFKAERL